MIQTITLHYVKVKVGSCYVLDSLQDSLYMTTDVANAKNYEAGSPLLMEIIVKLVAAGQEVKLIPLTKFYGSNKK